MGSPISAHEEYTNVCLHLKQGGGATLKPQNWLIVVLLFFFFFCDHLVAWLSQYSSTVCLVLLLHAGGRVGMTEEKAQL